MMTEQLNKPQAVKRHPIKAAFLSTFVFGLGQLYNGQLQKALLLFAFGIVPVGALSLVAKFMPSYQVVVFFTLAVLCIVAIWIFSIVDAFVSARRIGAVLLQRYNRWYVYVAIFLVSEIIYFPIEYPVATYSVASTSMAPGLLAGDWVLAHAYAYEEKPVERGDIAVFKLPTNGSDYLMRIIGLPGDNIQLKTGILHINGKAVGREPAGIYSYHDTYGREHNTKLYNEILPGGRIHMIIEESDQGVSDNTIEYTVPSGHYFAMGDNRDNSKDSRYLDDVGFIPHENITGKVMLIYFSKQLERIGKSVN